MQISSKSDEVISTKFCTSRQLCRHCVCKICYTYYKKMFMEWAPELKLRRIDLLHAELFSTNIRMYLHLWMINLNISHRICARCPLFSRFRVVSSWLLRLICMYLFFCSGLLHWHWGNCMIILFIGAYWCHIMTVIWLALAQVMACCLMTPSHYLNQCWLFIWDFVTFTSEQFHSEWTSYFLCNWFTI